MFSFTIEQLQLKPSCYFRQIFILNRSTDLKNSLCVSCRLGSVIFTRAPIFGKLQLVNQLFVYFGLLFFHIIFLFFIGVDLKNSVLY